MTRIFCCIFAVFIQAMPHIYAQEMTYQSPPSIIADLADGVLTPGVALSPDKKTLLLMHHPGLPFISELAAEELRLGGLRIDPNTNGGSRSRYYDNLTLQSLHGKESLAIKQMPTNPQLQNISWAPDGSKLAFTHTLADGIELWIIEVASATARKVEGVRINDAVATIPYRWFSDSKHLILQSTAEDRGPRPKQLPIRKGPIVQENSEGAAPNRSFQDLIKSPHDESLFAYYTHSDLQIYSVPEDRLTDFKVGGIITSISLSPDGQYVLVHELKRPFSYSVPYYRFAKKSTIFNRSGDYIRTVADLAAAEHLPQGFNAVAEGPRQFSWRSDHDATLCWVEAQDGGDPRKEVDLRDQLFMLSAPFVEDPVPSVSCSLRYSNIIWGDGDFAILKEYWWRNRREITSIWKPDSKDYVKKILFDRSYEDQYTDPGYFHTELNHHGRSVLMRSSQNHLYLIGMGASQAGNRPFIDTFDPSTKETNRLWRSEAPFYEVPMTMLDKEKGLVITRRESKVEPPNYFVRDLTTQALQAITNFDNPYKAMQGVKKDLIKYSRKDGIELTGTLYLPAGFRPEKDDRLPVLMWAYPREYKSKEAAGQVRNSPYEFLRLYPGSPVFWVMRGYAVLDNFAMPIIGEGQDEPNETFVPQLVQGAQAAVDKLVQMNVADPDRIAVGGHSYGAFMAANLLAHSDIFAAGISRSGAYNRTLTPFGFQTEERTFWEVPDIYFGMSPFMHADKIKEPLLLIHGQADDNAGTYPMQSERFYAALKGHGATTRLVMLPHESHGYRARESVMHMLWEMDEWLEKYVKRIDQQ